MFKKILVTGAEFDHAEELLQQAGNGENNGEIRFLRARPDRAWAQRRRAARIWNNPVMKTLGL